MLKTTTKINRIKVIGAIAAPAVIAGFLVAYLAHDHASLHNLLRKAASSGSNNTVKQTLDSLQASTCQFTEPTPWASIGGCGAGGSGGGAGDGIKWTGNGVTGGLVDVEMITRYSYGQNFNNQTLSSRFSFKPEWTRRIGLNIPFMTKTGEVQYFSNQPVVTRQTGGLGDLSVDFSQTFGTQGEFSLSLGMSLPTGQFDIKRGPDAAVEFLPISLQKGMGVNSGMVMFDYTKDVEDGMWLGNATLSFPFALSVSGENQFLDTYFSANRKDTNNRRFFYRFKPYGENDLGGFTPPSASASLTYAYRGDEHYVHSCTFLFAAPLGVAWVPSEKTTVYDPHPDPDHKAWSAALAYGLEFSNPKFPLYLAISFPLHDKTNDPGADLYDPTPFAKWDTPDFADFLQQGTLAIGIKATMF